MKTLRWAAWKGPLVLLIAATGLLACSQEPPLPGRGDYTPAYQPQPPRPAPPESEIEGEVRAALGHPDPLVRAERLASLLRSLGPESVEDVRTAFDETFVDLGDVELVLFLEWWARSRPAEAFDWLFENWAGRDASVLSPVMRTWARQDPEAASAAALQLNPIGLMQAAVDGLVRGWDESGKPGLLNYIVKTMNLTDRQLAIMMMARRRVLEFGPDEAIRWAESLPDMEREGDKVKQHVLQRVASAVAEVDPHKAAAFAERHEGTRYEYGMVRRVAARWIPQDPLAAMSWLSTLKITPETQGAVSSAYRTWFGVDRAEAIAWLLDADLEPWMDPCIVHYVLTVIHADIDDSMQWIRKIADPELAHDTHLKLARIAHLQDAEQAADWIAAQGFSEDEIRRITLPAPGGSRKQTARKAAHPPAEPQNDS